MMRWCGHTKAAPTGMAVVTMGTDIWEPPHVEASGRMARVPTVRRHAAENPRPQKQRQATKIASRAGYRQDSIYWVLREW